MLISCAKKSLCGAKVLSIDDFMKIVVEDIKKNGVMAKSAIPEEYDLLRTIQMTINGYLKKV